MTIRPTRRWAALVAVPVTLAAVWLGAGTAVAATAPAAVTSLSPGHVLPAGTDLRSSNGAYLLTLHTDGELTLTGHGRTLWHTTARAASTVLYLRADGNLVLESHARFIWQTNTRGAPGSRLELIDTGVLTLYATGGTAWSDALGNGCAASSGAHHVTVDIYQQRARLCAYHQQVLVTPVTTGASSEGDATPTGSWHVYAKVRNTVLYPAAGGAYPVHYWMPYDGAYGMHDSPWQHFPYGSSLYKTRGSHGCVHFPASAMERLYAWAPVGTAVTVVR
jgi:L,D-transpeptidase catalytic domain